MPPSGDGAKQWNKGEKVSISPVAPTTLQTICQGVKSQYTENYTWGGWWALGRGWPGWGGLWTRRRRAFGLHALRCGGTGLEVDRRPWEQKERNQGTISLQDRFLKKPSAHVGCEHNIHPLQKIISKHTLHPKTHFKQQQVVCSKNHSSSSSIKQRPDQSTRYDLPGTSLLTDDGLKSVSTYCKQNKIYTPARRHWSQSEWLDALSVWIMLILPCRGREGCPRLGLLGAEGSPWVGEGQGLLRGEGRGEDPGAEPAPGWRCWGRISSTSSSTSPDTEDKLRQETRA